MAAELVCAAGDRGAWLKARRSGVTATDIVTILGLNPWGSEYALYWEKLGKLPPWEGSPRTALGLVLQPYIQTRWMDAHAEVMDAHAEVLFGHDELYRSPERPWQLATPDGFVAAPGTSGPTIATWEGKTWDDHDRAAWEDGVPPRVRAQVLWQMDTLGVGTGHVGVLFLPSGEFESRMILAEPGEVDADIAYMRQVGEAFWARVGEGLPPFPDGSPATLAAVKALHAGVCAGQVEVDPGLWNAWVGARMELKQWENSVREHEARLRIELGGAEVGTVGGEPVVKRTMYGVASKAIERKAYAVDKLTRLGARNGDSDGDTQAEV